jgi:pimeloyl-ACP methyl ester carboxylesterase
MPPSMPELDGVRHSYVDVNGFRAHIAEAGDPDAAPVVMQHGWPQHWWCWRKVIPQLAERYRVICPDLRGHGWSDAPPSGYSKPQLARDLIGVLDALGLERVRLVGHDWGAMAGFLACLGSPERFERYLAMGITPPLPSGDPKQLLGIWKLYYQLPLTAPFIAPRLVAKPDFIKRFLRAGLVRRDAMTDRDMDLFAQAVVERPHVTLGIYRTFLLREFAPMAAGRWAGRLRVPTRVLAGDHDIVTDAKRIRMAAERYADDMTVQDLQGVGHFVPEEVPDVVGAAALDFFA